jgi:hypothetical protein
VGTAVAQWLRYCATNQKVAGSIPDGVMEYFFDINHSWFEVCVTVHHDHKVNEYSFIAGVVWLYMFAAVANIITPEDGRIRPKHVESYNTCNKAIHLCIKLDIHLPCKSFWSHYRSGVDSASNRNEYQDCFLGVNAALPYNHPVPLSRNLRTLTSWNPLGHSGPVTGLLYCGNSH